MQLQLIQTDTKWVYGTAADYDQWGSTTDVEFSGWPTNWQQIRVSFIDISINHNAYVQFFVSKVPPLMLELHQVMKLPLIL